MQVRLSTACLFAACCFALATQASAAPLISYQYNPASLDPATQGWSDSGVGTITDDVANAALNVHNAAGNSLLFEKTLGGSSVTDPTGWTLTATVMAITAPSAPYSVAFGVDTGAGGAFWNVYLTNQAPPVPGSGPTDGIWTVGSGLSTTPLAAVPTVDTAFHTYQLINTNGNVATAPQLWIDGVNTGKVAQDGGSFLPAGTVFWPTASGTNTTEADWQFVSFQLGQHPVAAVPEPSAFALFACSVVALAGLGRLRKR